MKKSRRTLGIAASLVLSLGILLPLSVRATEPADGAQGEETYSDTQQEDTYTDTRSGDNSLSTLSISPGTLSPDFKYSVINYTASVGADVTSVDVNAKTSNAAAKILSITGNTDLKEGENTISISVEAENGAPVTYRIVVTRGGEPEAGEGEPASQEEETQGEEAGSDAGDREEGQKGGDPEEISLNGHPFNLAATIPEDQIPEGFSVVDITCKGQQVQGLQFDKVPSLRLVYLTTPSTEVKNTLAVYEEGGGSIYPFRKVKIGKRYVILLNPPAEAGISEDYAQTSAKIGKFEDVPVFAKEGSEFSLVYAASSQGNIGWYQYDTVEKSYQRYIQDETDAGSLGIDEEESSAQMQGLRNAYKDLEEQYNHRKDSSRKAISVLVFLVVVLVIVVINLLLHRRRRDYDEWEEEGHDYAPPKARRKRVSKEDEGFEEGEGDEDPDYALPRARRKSFSQKEEQIEEDAGYPADNGKKRVRKAWKEEEGVDFPSEKVREKKPLRKRPAYRGQETEGEDLDYASSRIGKKRRPAKGEGAERDEDWQEEDPVFAELNPRSRKRMQEKDDWDQKSLDAEKDDWDQHTSPSKEDWDAPKPRRNLNETAELRLDDDFEVIDLEDL